MSNNPFDNYQIPWHHFNYVFLEDVGGLREPAVNIKYKPDSIKPPTEPKELLE